MGSESPPRSLFAPRLMWIVWPLGLAIWTYLLISPVEWLPPWLRFGPGGISKLLTWSRIGHAATYALLAAIVPFLPIRRSCRIVLWCLLSIHAGVTEYVQTMVPTRTGSWIDVVADHVGIGVGLAVGLAWTRQRKTPPVEAHHNSG